MKYINILVRAFCLFSIAIFALGEINHSHLYYEDAKCLGEEEISGSMFLSSEKNVLKVENYSGRCKFVILLGTSKSESDGYCMSCDGVVGCSSTRNSCVGFSTNKPTTSSSLRILSSNSKQKCQNSQNKSKCKNQNKNKDNSKNNNKDKEREETNSTAVVYDEDYDYSDTTDDTSSSTNSSSSTQEEDTNDDTSGGTDYSSSAQDDDTNDDTSGGTYYSSSVQDNTYATSVASTKSSTSNKYYVYSNVTMDEVDEEPTTRYGGGGDDSTSSTFSYFGVLAGLIAVLTLFGTFLPIASKKRGGNSSRSLNENLAGNYYAAGDAV